MSKVSRLLVVLLIAAIISIFAMPYVVHRKLPPSPLIEMHHRTTTIGVPEASAQVETGVLVAWLTSVAGPAAITASAIEFIYTVLKDIIPLLSGRPAAAATYCVAKFFAFSQNRLVQTLGKSFAQVLSWGDTLSSNWWNFAAVANMFCQDMETKCGYQTGNYVCHSYLNIALDADFQPCVSSSAAAAYLRDHFDTTFPQCQ